MTQSTNQIYTVPTFKDLLATFEKSAKQKQLSYSDILDTLLLIMRALEATSVSQPFDINIFCYLCLPYDFANWDAPKAFFADFVKAGIDCGRIREVPSIEGGLYHIL